MDGELRLKMSGAHINLQQTLPFSKSKEPGANMNCEEKARLAQAYDAATTRFAEAVRQYRQNIGTSTQEEYERLQRVSEEARVKSEQARLALEEHLAAHSC